MSEMENDVDERLAALDAKETELTQRCLYRSASRVASEIRRVAKAEKRIIPYIQATFTVMNNAIDLLEPEIARDAAVEIIGLLESEDRARSIQPDLPEQEYEGCVHWYTPCGYDNLAKATAVINGYNSDGIHACIAEGIQVCRREGKLQCITCFREYATDVHRAADDLDMAMHNARLGIANVDPGPHDRRWAGAKDLTIALVHQGKLDAAAESVERARELCETWHTASSARLHTKQMMIEIAHLLGDPTRWANSVTDDESPKGEFPWLEMRRDQAAAVVACCEQDYEKAIALLTEWDRTLTKSRSLDDWFDTRLRLLCAHRLAGNQTEFVRLADQLEGKARTARDWLTLRCLERLRDESIAVAPVPLVADLNCGPFAGQPSSTTGAAAEGVQINSANDESQETGETQEEVEETEAGEQTGPPEIVLEFWDRMNKLRFAAYQEVEIDDSFEQILADMLAIDPASDYSAEETQWLLHTIRFAIGDGKRGREVWRWAETLMSKFSRDAVALSLFATLGSSVRFGENEELEDLITEEQLEKMFRESLDLDANAAKNFNRAGDFFRFMENLGEAERCYARGFRLDRSNSVIAQALANVYRRTDRERDALAVLDMTLREGCDDPDVSWNAALAAHQLHQNEAALTYLEAYEKLAPDQAWTNYYRASALLKLQRPAEALAAVVQEAIHNPECTFHVAVHRAVATAGLEQHAEFRERLVEVLAIPLAEIDYLTTNGICSLFAMLWNCVAELPEDDLLRKQVEDRAVAGGVSPNELFDTYREGNEPVDDVNFYEVVLHQPLDERWAEWHGRLSHEDEMTSYTVSFGVLAKTEDDAVAAVLQWQARAYPLPASVVEVELRDEGYRELLGVTWQGYREDATDVRDP